MNYSSVMNGFFKEVSRIFEIIYAELDNWNDDKSSEVKRQIDSSKHAIKMVSESAKMLDEDIKKMQDCADKVEEITRKTVGNDLF